MEYVFMGVENLRNVPAVLDLLLAMSCSRHHEKHTVILSQFALISVSYGRYNAGTMACCYI